MSNVFQSYRELSKLRLEWKIRDLKRLIAALERNLRLYQGSQEDRFYINICERLRIEKEALQLLEEAFYKKI